MRSHADPYPHPAPRPAFAGYRFPPEIITLAVRWYLRFALSYPTTALVRAVEAMAG
jgi:transposase-like protein